MQQCVETTLSALDLGVKFHLAVILKLANNSCVGYSGSTSLLSAIIY